MQSYFYSTVLVEKVAEKKSESSFCKCENPRISRRKEPRLLRSYGQKISGSNQLQMSYGNVRLVCNFWIFIKQSIFVCNALCSEI